MLLYITEDTFTGPATPATADAVRWALTSREWGFNRLLVAPSAPLAARQQGLERGLVEGLEIVQRGWLEGQSLLESLTRIVALVDQPNRHGSLRGNIFEVSTERAVNTGIFREPVLVTENMATDGAFFRFMFGLWNKRPEPELRRFWNARLEQGGGDPIRNYVGRYIENPEPMGVMCDRDSAGFPACGTTVKNCATDLVIHGLFPDRDTAKRGGFSSVAANFSFEVLDAWSVESFVFPHISQQLLDHTMNQTERQERTEALRLVFPSYPNLDDDEAVAWLGTNFKRFLDGRPAWNSNSVKRLIEWAKASEANRAVLQAAFDADFRVAPFAAAADRLFRTWAALGVREHRLL